MDKIETLNNLIIGESEIKEQELTKKHFMNQFNTHIREAIRYLDLINIL